ncbi:hypothetical protein TRFO_40365 [Tritrichomonas foetus]|uniref:Uncharacterized protein n=1 Tax=Tritrichomonas foetus TaxID=1144522 RepID=A0A1J4J172_9EUKA|nr:hypothetical protein TRFO_40365 [Tritrichomonas foetus]|eukprot:OHS93350.1 hypothetical protein TRFO_40365 [Tritrichomonas foetus]
MAEEEEYVSDSEDSEKYYIVNSSHQLFLDLRDKFYSRVKPHLDPNSFRGMALPSPIIFEAQLIQASDDRFSLRSDLEILIRKNIIRCFNLFISHYSSERYFMLEIDYIDTLERMNDKTINSFLNMIKEKRYISPTMSSKTLEEYGFTQYDIKYLINKKILLLNQGKGQQYSMSIPSSANVIASISSGRRALVNYLSKQKNKITERSNVERQNIKDSIFYGEFHVQELLGLGVFEEINIPGRPPQLILKRDPYPK